MIDNITNVTPDGEEPTPVAPVTCEEKQEKQEKTDKKDRTRTSRNVAMGAAVAGAAVAGAAVAEAMQPGEAPEVEEVAINEQPVQPAAEIFGRKDAEKDVPEHKDESATEPDSDEKAQLHEPDLEADGKEDDIITVIEPDEDETEEVAVHDIPETEEDPGMPEFIEQPEMGHIDVEIDENMNYDDAGDIIG